MKSNNESVGLEGLIEQAATEKDSRGTNADAFNRITNRITDLIADLEQRSEWALRNGDPDVFAEIVDSLKVALLGSKCEPLTPVRVTASNEYTPDDYLDECVAEDAEPSQYGFECWAEEQFAEQEIGECETTPIPNA
jgi:hypothetical protein